MSIRPFIVTSILFISGIALAQESVETRAAPIESIADGQFSYYKDMYNKSPLCEKSEITLWTCETQKKIYSLCSSEKITKNSGYIQYRASKAGRTIFVFPASKRPPFGIFTYLSSANGDAFISFSNGSYEYNVIDPLRYSSSIEVTSTKPQVKTTGIPCKNSNQTLQVNYTMRLMYDAGIWQGY